MQYHCSIACGTAYSLETGGSMAYTEKELQRLQNSLDKQFADMKMQNNEKMEALCTEIKSQIQLLDAVTTKASALSQKMDEEFQKENGITLTEFRQTYKEDINKYILEHPEQFGEDPELIHD